MARIRAIQTGGTLVSPAVPDRFARRSSLAYTGVFQRRSKRINLPVKCFLVEVGKRKVLVDTGWHADCAVHPLRHLGFGLWFASEPVLAHGEDAASQLAAMGIAPRDLDAVVLTHMDCDHASGLSAFAGARLVLAAPAELERARTRDVRYRSAFWKGVDFTPVEWRSGIEPDRDACDLFGDGSIELVSTPGHTAGSLCVRVREGGRFALIVGDTGYNAASWDQLKLPGPVFDKGQMLDSLTWVRDQRALDACAGVYAAHDPAIAPGWYEV